MGATCSHDRMRCFMKLEAFVSVILFIASMYMFYMIGYYTNKNRNSLLLVFGLLGSLNLVGGIVTSSYAINIWRDLRKENAQSSENSARRVRFSSLVEIHGDVDRNSEQENGNLDHEYEEISPRKIFEEKEAGKDQKRDEGPSNSDRSDIQLPSIRDQLHIAGKQTLQNNDQTELSEWGKMHLNSRCHYGTFEGNDPDYSEGNIEEHENGNGDEIII